MQKHLIACFLLLSGCAKIQAQWASTQGPGGGQIYDIVQLGNRLWAAGYGGLFYSGNEGKTWTHAPVLDCDQYAVGLHAFNGKLFALYPGPNPNEPLDIVLHLSVSTDGGQTWIERPTPIDFYVYPPRLFSSAGYLLLADDYALYRSTDDGLTWETSALPADTYIDFLSYDDKRLSILDLKNVLYLSENGGINWTNTFEFQDQLSFYSVTLHDSTLIAGAGFDTLLISQDLGKTWAPFQAPIPPNYAAYFLYGPGDTIFCLVDDIYFSVDQAASWQLFTKNNLPGIDWVFTPQGIYTGGPGGVVFFDYQKNDWSYLNKGMNNTYVRAIDAGSKSVVAIARDSLYTTADAGAHWKAELKMPSTQASAQLLTTAGDTAFLLTSGRLWYTILGSGKPDTLLIFPSGSQKSMRFQQSKLVVVQYNKIQLVDPKNASTQDVVLPEDGNTLPNDAFLLLEGNRMIYANDDYQVFVRGADTSWTEVIQEDYVGSFGTGRLFNAGDQIIYVNRFKWWVSGTGGLTWISFLPSGTPQDGFDNLMVPSRLVAKGNTFYASFRGEGVFRSTNGGHTWTDVSAGLDCKKITDIQLKDNYLYASTDFGGVWKLDLTTAISDPPPPVVEVYPNPANGQVHLPWQPEQIRLLDGAGRLQTAIFHPADNRLDLSRLTSGLYVGHFLHNGRWHVARIVRL